jgi:eukaryotic-like serine/threonine-protein kinase
MALEAGQIIDGKYRIVRMLGAGGMGVVYEGENLLIRRRVAIKVMIASGGDRTAESIRRFEREAQAAGQIGSDHILEVLDLGTLENGDRFMVMEYLDGETLAERILRHIRLSPRQIAPIARQFLAALASAHAAGVIHRDLKPENIFILRSKAGRSDFVKLIDFGVSKFAQSLDGIRTTRAGSLLGTPCYMSPEQARGRGETDVRSDIYSCGVILYESVTGKLPFDGETFNDLMFKIALSEAPSPLTIVPSLDPEFAWLIARAMDRDPAARFQTVQEFSEKLDAWMRKNELTGTLAQPLPAEAFPSRDAASSSKSKLPVLETLVQSLDGDIEAMQLKATSSDDSWARSQQATAPPVDRRNRIALLVLAGIAVVTTAIVATLALRSGPTTPPPNTLGSSAPVVSASSSVAEAPPPLPSTEAPPPVDLSEPPVARAASTSVSRTGALPTPSTKPKPRPSGSGRPGGPAKPLDFGY